MSKTNKISAIGNYTYYQLHLFCFISILTESLIKAINPINA